MQVVLLVHQLTFSSLHETNDFEQLQYLYEFWKIQQSGLF